MILAFLLACTREQTPPATTSPPPVPEPPAPVVEAPAPAPTGPPVQLVVSDLSAYEAPNRELIAGRVYPVGWSPAGLFAYVYEPADEACGCFRMSLIVQDLVTDKVVWQKDEQADTGTVATVWQAHETEYATKLTELGVVRRDEPKLAAFSDALRADITTTTVGADSPAGYAHVASYAVNVTGPKGGKTIYEGGATGDYGPLEVKSPGYLASPDSARAAVLIVETWRGYEEKPYVAKLRFSGADLEKGWK